MSPVTTTITFGASPVRVSGDVNLKVAAISFHLAKTATGTAYIGTSALNKATLANVITEVAPGDPDFTIATQYTSNRLHPPDYWVDGASGEKMLVSFWLA